MIKNIGFSEKRHLECKKDQDGFGINKGWVFFCFLFLSTKCQVLIYFEISYCFNIIGFRCIAQWLDNHILFRVSPRYFQPPPGIVEGDGSVTECQPYGVCKYFPFYDAEITPKALGGKASALSTCVD